MEDEINTCIAENKTANMTLPFAQEYRSLLEIFDS